MFGYFVEPCFGEDETGFFFYEKGGELPVSAAYICDSNYYKWLSVYLDGREKTGVKKKRKCLLLITLMY